MTNTADLDDLWLRLASAPTHRQFRSLRVLARGRLDVHAAIRSADGARCLLFDLAQPESMDIGFEAGGLRLTRVALDDGLAFALFLEDVARSDLFSTICADLIAYSEADDAARALRLVLERLEAWRHFLRTISGGMNRQEAIGLTGELHVLEALLIREAGLLPAWRAPDDGLHDFEHAGHALEVKTTLGPGWHVTISTLDQLDQTGLDRLDLIHVRLFETPTGDTMEDLIARIDARLPDDRERRAFSNALLQRELGPDDQAARTGLRTAVQQMTGYSVDDDFPRMRRSNIAGAIVELRYVLDLAQVQNAAGPATAAIDSFGGRGE